jgi:hypothetical protein
MRYLQIVAPAGLTLCCAVIPAQAPAQAPAAQTGVSLAPAEPPPAAGGLPAGVASLAAVAALQRNDPPAFERFKKRFASASADARDVEMIAAPGRCARASSGCLRFPRVIS